MKRSAALVVLAAAVLGAVARADAADVKILSANGMRDSVRELPPAPLRSAPCGSNRWPANSLSPRTRPARLSERAARTS